MILNQAPNDNFLQFTLLGKKGLWSLYTLADSIVIIWE